MNVLINDQMLIEELANENLIFCIIPKYDDQMESQENKNNVNTLSNYNNDLNNFLAIQINEMEKYDIPNDDTI